MQKSAQDAEPSPVLCIEPSPVLCIIELLPMQDFY